MRRPPTMDEANGIDHMLNRGNRREPLFHKTEDVEVFERIMVEAIERSRIKLDAYCLTSNHWLRVVRPGGTVENSPAIYRWVRDPHQASGVPAGRLKGDAIVAHSDASCLYHCVWSTKERQRLITAELQERLWPYVGGIAKQKHRIDYDPRYLWD